jgi:hypothetical protein
MIAHIARELRSGPCSAFLLQTRAKPVTDVKIIIHGLCE